MGVWVALRIAQQIHLPLLVGFWTFLAVTFIGIDLFPSLLKASSNRQINALRIVWILLAFSVAIGIESSRDSFFYWTDHGLRVFSNLSGTLNWIILCAL